MNGLDVDDLPRRLADLADAAGPWDDPMPEIRRRAALASTRDAASEADSAYDADLGSASSADPVSALNADADDYVAANANVDVDADTGVGAGQAPIRLRPASTRAKRRRRWSVDPFTIASVAAVVLLVVGLGWLIHGAGSGDSSEKAAGAATSTDLGSSAAAGSAGTRGLSGTAGGASEQHSASVPAPSRVIPTSACGITPGRSSALSLRAPTTVRTGGVLSVRVRLVGDLAGRAQSQVIVAVAGGQVVGRLVTTGAKAGPGAVPAVAVLTGTLRTSTCDQVTPKPGPTTPRTLPGKALAPGRYQLIVVVRSARAVTASGAVDVTVTP